MFNIPLSHGFGIHKMQQHLRHITMDLGGEGGGGEVAEKNSSLKGSN